MYGLTFEIVVKESLWHEYQHHFKIKLRDDE